MSEQFTFVSVKLTHKHLRSARRGEGIDAKDRTKIRSYAATCPWNKKLRLKGEAPRPTHKRKKQALDKPTKNVVDILEYEDIRDWSMSPSVALSGSDMSLGGEVDELYTAGLTPLWTVDNGEDDVEYTLESPSARLHFPQTSGPTLHRNGLAQRDPLVAAIDQSLPKNFRSEQIDPFWSFSVPYRPCLSAAIEHRVTYFGHPIPEVDQDGESALLKHFTNWMDNVGYMFATLLFAARHLYESQLQSSWTQEGLVTPNDIIWLEGCALNAVNNLLRKPHMTAHESEACLGAVLSLAIYENCFGDPEKYRSHLSGAKRIIALKGGIAGLDPLQQRLIKYMTDHMFMPELEDAQAYALSPALGADAESERVPVPKRMLRGSSGGQMPLDFMHMYCGPISYAISHEDE